MSRFVLLVLLLACASDGRMGTPPTELDTLPLPASLPRGTETPEPGTCNFRGGTGRIGEECEADGTSYFALSRLHLPDVEIVDGREVVAGVDRDARLGTLEDSAGCNIPDFDSPDGIRAGIDNQGASIRPTFDSVIGGGVNGAARAAITAGSTTVLELRGWNGSADDDCVEVTAFEAFATGAPTLDAESIPVAGTSYSLGSPRSFVRGTMRDGTLVAEEGGFPLVGGLLVDLRGVHLRVDLVDGELRGLAAGEVQAPVLGSLLACLIPGVTPEIGLATAESIADLRPDEDGICTSISWTVEIEARPATIE